MFVTFLSSISVLSNFPKKRESCVFAVASIGSGESEGWLTPKEIEKNTFKK